MDLRFAVDRNGGWSDPRVWGLAVSELAIVALDLAQHPIIYLPLLAVPLLALVLVAQVRVVVELSCLAVAGVAVSAWVNDYLSTQNGIFWVAALIAIALITITASVANDRVRRRQTLAEHRLAESERYYRVLAENATDLVFLATMERRLEWAAPSVERLLGWRPEELVGRDVVDFVRPESRDAFEQMRAPMRRVDGTAHEAELEFEMRCKDGRYIWLAGTGKPILGEDGAPMAVVVGLRDVTEAHLAHEELVYRALHDPLTGLRNRAWILDMLMTDLRAAQRDSTRLGVMFIDLDNFKDINDSFGHQAGDVVLRRIAERIAGSLRPGDRLGRFGGDEFIVVSPGIREPQELESMADRLGKEVAVELEVEGQTVVPSASIGIAISDDRSSPESLVRETDAALFRAKGAGRSRWVFYNRQAVGHDGDRIATCAELMRGIEAGEFVLHYQPIVRLEDAGVIGHEALLRWNHPGRGLLYPMEFLPLAQECGLIVQLGEQVVSLVCKLIASRPDLSGPVSINVAPEQLASPVWAMELLATLAHHRVPPDRLVLELTEKSLRSVSDSSRDQLVQLRLAGVGLHIDDFGIGRSSVGLLRELPVTGLKLDASLTRRLDSEASVRELSAGLAGLAEGLNLMSVAEGIENSGEARTLREQGWTYAQGHYYGRPEPEPGEPEPVAGPGPS